MRSMAGLSPLRRPLKVTSHGLQATLVQQIPGDACDQHESPSLLLHTAACGLASWSRPPVRTPTGVRELGAAQEAQVARARPHGLRVPETQPGVEVVCVQGLLAIDGVVACGIVGAAHPDLPTESGEKEMQDVSTLQPELTSAHLKGHQRLSSW